jgi:hypothetical protein
MLPSDIPEAVYSSPALLGILVVAVAAALHWQAGLSYREYITAHRLKCYVFSILDPWATKHGRPLLRVKGPADQSNEFVTTVTKPPREVARRLHGPFETHLVATAKGRERTTRTGKYFQWSHSQWVTFYEIDGEEWQTEVYLFSNGVNTTDVYAHAEPAVTDPQRHTEGQQLPGDAHGHFQAKYGYNAPTEP